MSWYDPPPPPKPKFRSKPTPKPPRRRPFRDGEFVCRPGQPERVGQVVIPSPLPFSTLIRSPTLAERLGQRPRVKVLWERGAYEWVCEADLTLLDAVSELGRLL